MRLVKRGRIRLQWGEQEMLGAIRPLSGTLAAKRYGEYVQDMLRILLPWHAKIAPGDRVKIGDTPYICIYVRALPGHMQADLRRCSR